MTLRHLPAATVQGQEGEASRVRRSARSELAGWADSPRSIGRIRSVGAGRRIGLCLCQECTANSCIVRRKPEISLLACIIIIIKMDCEINVEKHRLDL